MKRLAPIDLDLCISGLDVFQLLSMPGVPCVFTSMEGQTVHLESAGGVIHIVRPNDLAEIGPVVSDISYIEFHAGYVDGTDAIEANMPISTRLMGRIPTDHGRGLSFAAEDFKRGVYRPTEWAYNECCRALRRLPESEGHWMSYPSSDSDRTEAYGFGKAVLQ